MVCPKQLLELEALPRVVQAKRPRRAPQWGAGPLQIYTVHPWTFRVGSQQPMPPGPVPHGVLRSGRNKGVEDPPGWSLNGQ